jgi:hypothetical protein
MVALPESRPEDDEDVVWGLSTASALWARGERRDAIVWLRRAADAAVAAGQEFRGSELGMYASELEDTLGRVETSADGAPIEGDPAEASGTEPASPEVIELLDIEADRPSQISIDLEDDTTLEAPARPPPPGRIALTPGPVPPPRSAFPPSPVPITGAPPNEPPSSAPSPEPGVAPPVADVEIPPPAPVGVTAPQMPHSFELTPMPSSSSASLRAPPASARRMTPTPRKSQPRGPILDPWADEPTDPGISVARPTVSFRQSDGGDELVLPRRAPTLRTFDLDDEVVTSAAPLDASLTRKVEPRPPRNRVARPMPPTAPGQLAQAAVAVPSKGLSVPPPPASPSAPAPKGTPPAPPPSKVAAAPPAPPAAPIEAAPPVVAAPVSSAPAAVAPAPPPVAVAATPVVPPAPIKPAAPAITAPVASKQSIPPPATPWPAPAAAKPSVPPPPVVTPPPPRATMTPAPPPASTAPPAPTKLSVPPPPVVAGAPKLTLPRPPALPSLPKPNIPPPAVAVAPALPVLRSVPPPAPALIDGVPLDEVDAFSDLPPDMQHRLAALARIEALSADEEVSSFGAALLLAGEASVCATIVDTPACRAVKGTLVPSRGSLSEPVGIRVVAGAQGARIAIWDQPVIEDALKSCPWVLDELVSRADRIQALAGATMGPLGELDEAARGELLDRLTVHFAQPFESLVDDGGDTLGIAVVGGGVVELAAHGDLAAKALHPGEMLFPRAVIEGRPAPRTANAGASGALVLIGEAKIAMELMASSPPLAALLTDATD